MRSRLPSGFSEGVALLRTLRAFDPILLSKREVLGPRTVDPLVSQVLLSGPGRSSTRVQLA
ncbi:MAG: hypothetical protein KGI98_08110 [Euryarchaeota archaeon]|nr:hypothetical protein [Euryarchaeota archaeon]